MRIDVQIFCTKTSAIYLGDISKSILSWVTITEVLRVEVANHLVSIAGDLSDLDPALKERLNDLLGMWKVCRNEEVSVRPYEADDLQAGLSGYG